VKVKGPETHTIATCAGVLCFAWLHRIESTTVIGKCLYSPLKVKKQRFLAPHTNNFLSTTRHVRQCDALKPNLQLQYKEQTESSITVQRTLMKRAAQFWIHAVVIFILSALSKECMNLANDI